ncbi:Low complexity protein witha potential C2C2 zinc ribbon [Cryptosporidium felis]|nr:Low complexity protein witha potential C2C2 zinc ribbon [Cryptosporidium felis]
MEHLITEIENISINSFHTDELSKETDKNESYVQRESFSTKSLCEDSQVYPLSKNKGDTPIYSGNCILCRDYSSPICRDCSRQESKDAPAVGIQNNIIPDGKVRALARQFEDILPEMNRCLTPTEYELDLKYLNCLDSVRPKDNSVTVIDPYLEPRETNLYTNHITPIKDPEICGSIDPIEAIIDNSNFPSIKITTNSSLNISNSILNEPGTLSISKIVKAIESTEKDESNIVEVFESLNPLEQRTLLVTWITSTLNLPEMNTELSGDEINEIVFILKGIINELENEEKNGIGTSLANSTEPLHIFNKKKFISNCEYNQNFSNNRFLSSKSEVNTLNFKGKIIDNIPNSRMQINIGIPEDEEIEEEYISEYICRKNIQMNSDLELSSVLNDKDILSPKSEISSNDGFNEEISIINIGYSFFGFNDIKKNII